MTFYTIEFLKNQNDSMVVIYWSMFWILLVTFAGLELMYVKNRKRGRYRDFAILVLLVAFFVIGLRIEALDGLKQVTNNKSQLVTVLEQVADSEGVSKDKVAIDNQTVSSNMIVKVDKEYFELQFNNDMNSYTLAPATVTVPDKQIEVKTGDK